jgi:hypothetical protein
VTSNDDVGRALPAMLLTLTVVTGVVDAASYLSLGHVFVANMTGNVVFSCYSRSCLPVRWVFRTRPHADWGCPMPRRPY